MSKLIQLKSLDAGAKTIVKYTGDIPTIENYTNRECISTQMSEDFNDYFTILEHTINNRNNELSIRLPRVKFETFKKKFSLCWRPLSMRNHEIFSTFEEFKTIYKVRESHSGSVTMENKMPKLSLKFLCGNLDISFDNRKMRRFLPPFMNALKYKQRIGIIDGFGKHSYNDLYNQSKVLSKSILKMSKVEKDQLHKHPMKGEKVAFLCSNDHTYITAQWGAWMAGSTAVPLSKYHPQREMEFVIKDCMAKVVVCTENHADLIHRISENLGVNFLVFSPLLEGNNQVNYKNMLKLKLPDMYVSDEQLVASWNQIHWEETDAQIIYTSGTTGRPKGVVTTFTNMCSQIEDLNHAWNITSEDGYLHILPLHHLHGIVNNLISPLSVGACVTMLPEFNAEKVWQHLLEDPNVNVFHAVPTIYSKLIEFYQDKLTEKADHIRKVLSTKFRLMVSGSAALPVPTLKRWEEISGHVLLERYGMTEIGMALTNSLHGKRVEGAVGKPFPSFKFKIESDDKRVLAEGDHNNIVKYEDGDGSLLVKGASVFKEYLNLDKATKESFDEDGWFITGDTAVYDIEHDVIRIMGRTSVDIINSAGYKMSALEIEKHLLSIKGIKEAVVVALPDEVYEEIVCAVIVPVKNNHITLKYIQEQCKDKMAKYKIPRAIRILDEIPKNPMGKVNKKELVKFIS